MASAVANRYAAALADVLYKPSAAQTPESAAVELRAFADTMAGSAELRNVFATPAVATGRKRELAGDLASRLEFGPAIRNLLFVLVDHGRMGALGEIAEAFAAEIDRRSGVARIRVASALPMSDDQRERLVERFRAVVGAKVEAEFAVDEDLLGGSVVRHGTRVYDGSLRARLRSLGRAMAEGV
jgi:F-type H+-transporting ATPase subunit delta